MKNCGTSGLNAWLCAWIVQSVKLVKSVMANSSVERVVLVEIVPRQRNYKNNHYVIIGFE